MGIILHCNVAPMPCFALAFWLVLAAVPMAAQTIAAIQPEGHVSDFSRVLNAAHKAELERYCRRVQELTGAEIAVVTIPTLGGEPIEDAANSLYRRWGIGQKGKDQGALLLLATADRRMRLEVGYGLEPVVPDGYAGTLLRSMRPLLRGGEYGAALLDATHQLGSRIADGKNVKLDAGIPSRREVRESIAPWLFLLIPGLFLLFIFWMGSRQKRRYGSYSGSSWPVFTPGGNWHSTSRGGFGGYDSSDSFGGFGGGDSGGGGASSDW
jgi:uncharacterized protein